jgi:hypothetical protein
MIRAGRHRKPGLGQPGALSPEIIVALGQHSYEFLSSFLNRVVISSDVDGQFPVHRFCFHCLSKENEPTVEDLLCMYETGKPLKRLVRRCEGS